MMIATDVLVRIHVLQDAGCRNHKIARVFKDGSGCQVFNPEFPDILDVVPCRIDDAMTELDISVELVFASYISEILQDFRSTGVTNESLSWKNCRALRKVSAYKVDQLGLGSQVNW